MGVEKGLIRRSLDVFSNEKTRRGSYSSFLDFSCPQAAKISCPRATLTGAEKPAFSNSLEKAITLLRELGS